MENTKRGRPKDEEKASAILKAAGTRFIQSGMMQTTMQNVADDAGVSKLTVYNHFGTKEELFKKIIQNKCKVHMGDELLKTALKQSPSDGLFTLGMGFVGIIYNDEAIAMHRTIMAESRHDTKIAQMFYENGPTRVHKMLNELLASFQNKGVCKFDDIARSSEVFLSLFSGATHMKTVLNITPRPTQSELEKFTRENVTFFFRIFSANSG